MQLDRILRNLHDYLINFVRLEVKNAVAAMPSTQGFDKDALHEAVTEALSNQDIFRATNNGIQSFRYS